MFPSVLKGENPLERVKTKQAAELIFGQFLALNVGHVSHAKCGHILACHIWLEIPGSILTPPSGITQFGDHFPSEKIEKARLV